VGGAVPGIRQKPVQLSPLAQLVAAQQIAPAFSPIVVAGIVRLAELCLAHKLPSLFGPKHHVQEGGLMSYSPDRADLWRRGAIYVDKVLQGIDPADLPVQQPTKFELVINLKTAKALGLTIPYNLLARADEVIE